ncbi:MAG: hypothetical protein Q7K03_10680 [Dehalococcoidia bacterium]|nr:hypothetical protein [Dehalococcoidia bacterium]
MACSEQVEALRELAIDLGRSKLTPSQAGVGVAVLSRLQSLGVEPGEIERWSVMCRQLAPQGTQPDAFVRAALALDEVRRRTGLEPEVLENKVKGLEERLARLEPTTRELMDCEQKLRDLEGRRQKLTEEVAALEKRALPLRRTVEGQERRESVLASRVQELEARAQTADERLAMARKDTQTLSALGLTPEQLSALVHRVGGIADRHHIQAQDLWGRLVKELESMDVVLGLEALAAQRKGELEDQATALAKVKKDRSASANALERLRHDEAALRSTLASEEQELVSALKAMAKSAQDAGLSLKKELRSATAQALAEVHEISEQALDVGRKMGRLESTVEANEWLRTLVALVAAEAGVSAASTRVVSLMVLRALSAWMDRDGGKTMSSTYLKGRVDGVISDLERWQS